MGKINQPYLNLMKREYATFGKDYFLCRKNLEIPNSTEGLSFLDFDAVYFQSPIINWICAVTNNLKKFTAMINEMPAKVSLDKFTEVFDEISKTVKFPEDFIIATGSVAMCRECVEDSLKYIILAAGGELDF